MILGDGYLDPGAIISCYAIEAVTIDINITLLYNIIEVHVKPGNKASYGQEKLRIGKTIVMGCISSLVMSRKGNGWK